MRHPSGHVICWKSRSVSVSAVAVAGLVQAITLLLVLGVSTTSMTSFVESFMTRHHPISQQKQTQQYIFQSSSSSMTMTTTVVSMVAGDNSNNDDYDYDTTSSSVLYGGDNNNDNDGMAGVGDDGNGGDIRVEPDTHEELMYALGVNLARQLGDIRPLVESGEELGQVAKGLLDTVVGRLNDDGQRLLLSKRGKELDHLIASRANALREKLETRGREMLQNMYQTEGVLALDTGVAVHVLEHGEDGPGEGAYPTSGSVVVIHYHGTLSDGTVFDSTLGGEPVKFPLAQVIPGWRDGLLNMHLGETAMLGIPPEQAYGPDGTPDGRIPGGSTLFFKIQLIDILSGAVGGSPSLLGADGQQLGNGNANGGGSSGLIGADGQPM